MKPRIILALGDAGGPTDTVVLDHRNHTIWRGKEFCRLPRMAFKIFSALLACEVGVLPKSDLIEVLWGDSEWGGPEDPHGYLSVLIDATGQRARFFDKRRSTVQQWLGVSIRSDHCKNYRIEWNVSPVRKVA